MTATMPQTMLNEALRAAAYSGDLKVAQQMIARGAELECFDASYTTPLHTAIAQRHFLVADLLIAAGADVNAQKNPGYSNTPLHLAIYLDARDGTDERTQYLLFRGADLARRAWIGVGKLTDQADALAQAQAQPDNKGAALAALIPNWQADRARLRMRQSMLRQRAGAKKGLKL